MSSLFNSVWLWWELLLIGFLLGRSSTLRNEELWNIIATQCSRNSKRKVQNLCRCRTLSGRLKRSLELSPLQAKGAYEAGKMDGMKKAEIKDYCGI